jgi:hypothetical protein
MLRKFRGSEIAAEIVKAVELIPAGREIVTFNAGENMPITFSLARQEIDQSTHDDIPEYSWDGERFVEIGFL